MSKFGGKITAADILDEIFQDVKEKKRSMGRTIKFNMDKDEQLLKNMRTALKAAEYKPTAIEKEDYHEGLYRYREMTMSEETFSHLMSELDKQSKIFSPNERQSLYDRAVRHVHFDGMTKKVINKIEKEERLTIGLGDK